MRRTVPVSLALLALLAAVPAVAAAQPAAPSTAVAAPRLFADSRMVVKDRISVEVIGKGPDVILIPGLASSRETWRATAERLRGRRRLHLVQLAGFAGEPARGNAAGAVFEPVLAEIDVYAATLKRPVVIGHSLGGTLGLALAQRSPGRLSRLMIVDALPFYGVLMGGPNATVDSVRPMTTAMTRGTPKPMPEAQTRAMMAQMATAPADVERIVGWSRASDPGVVVRTMADDMLADLRPGLATTRTPVTVLYETPLAPMMTSGFAALPSKTLVEVPGAKHFIMYDQPARFDAEVDRFLAGR